MLNKPSVENIPLQELVGDNSENIDVIFIRNYENNGYGNNNYNAYNKPPYVPNNRPFVPYPNANDKWKPVSSSNDNLETNKILMEQVASHNTMIQELSLLHLLVLILKTYNSKLRD